MFWNKKEFKKNLYSFNIEQMCEDRDDGSYPADIEVEQQTSIDYIE